MPCPELGPLVVECKLLPSLFLLMWDHTAVVLAEKATRASGRAVFACALSTQQGAHIQPASLQPLASYRVPAASHHPGTFHIQVAGVTVRNTNLNTSLSRGQITMIMLVQTLSCPLTFLAMQICNESLVATTIIIPNYVKPIFGGGLASPLFMMLIKGIPKMVTNAGGLLMSSSQHKRSWPPKTCPNGSTNRGIIPTLMLRQ